MTPLHVLAIAIAAAALLCVLIRPLRIDGAWWAGGGALLLAASGALAPRDALSALTGGADVYLFLIGMMALAAFARREGVFRWIAQRMLGAAGASGSKLLALVYVAGIVTTAFLSNDATIVVLTPAVLDALRRTDADPTPYVVACALIANAASFVLPIANPSNLLFYAHGMPPLATWFASFGVASAASIVLTYGALALVFRGSLRAPIAVRTSTIVTPRRAAFVVLAIAALALVTTASRSGPLGAVACLAAALAVATATTRDRSSILRIGREIAWPVVILTAGLFVLVRALEDAGAGALGAAMFSYAAKNGGFAAPAFVAVATALASNLANNLPVGLNIGHVVAATHPPAALASAALVGVNLGPNLTTNGSLATVLWLSILRREGIAMSPGRFALIGLAVTPAALLAAASLAR